VWVDAGKTPSTEEDEEDKHQAVRQRELETSMFEHEVSPHEVDEELGDPVDEGNVTRVVESARGHQDEVGRVTRPCVEECPNWSIDHPRGSPRNFQTFVPRLGFWVLS